MAILRVEPDAKLTARLGLPPTVFRIDESARDAVRTEQGEMQLDVLVDEHAKVLANDPRARLVEGPILALWANHVAGERGRSGDGVAAEHYARLGLQFAPTNLSLQGGLGLALLAQGRHADALVAFKRVMDDPRANFAPALWLAAGRTALHLGLAADAVRILEQVAAYVPDDAAFWDLLGAAREAAGMPAPQPRASQGAGWQEVPGPGSGWLPVDGAGKP